MNSSDTQCKVRSDLKTFHIESSALCIFLKKLYGHVKCLRNLITNLALRIGWTLRLMTFPDPYRKKGMGPAGLKIIRHLKNVSKSNK